MSFRVYELIPGAKKLLRLPYGVCIFEKPPRSIKMLRLVHECLGLRYVCTVGDNVTRNVMMCWRVPDIAIIDLRSGVDREVNHDPDVLSKFDRVFYIVNERSTISEQAISRILESRNLIAKGHRVLILVDGEEDLLSIPAIFLLDSTLVVYGNYFLNCICAVPSVGVYKIAALKLCALHRVREKTICDTCISSNT